MVFSYWRPLGCCAQYFRRSQTCRGVEQPPEFHPEGDVWVHTLLMLQLMDETKRDLAQGSNPTATDWAAIPDNGVYPSISLALGVLLHDVGKPQTFEVKDRIRFNNHCEVGARMALRICDRLRFTHKHTERVTQLVRDHLKFKDLPQMRPATLKRFLRQEGFEEHLELHRLDCLGSHRNLDLWRMSKDHLTHLKPEEIRPAPLISGDDLIALGYRPGPIFKEILKAVEDAQLDLLIHEPRSSPALGRKSVREEGNFFRGRAIGRSEWQQTEFGCDEDRIS